MPEGKSMIAIRRLAALILLAVALASPAESQAQNQSQNQVQSTRVTFLLVSDIYLMGDKAMADGQRRGGFARLATVVKAERARGGHVIFAHAGDTLSPSLMSGIDRGAHIITLTNLIPPDIFVPGNHEFDFGKDGFFKRMGEAKFPLYAANLRGPDGAPLPNFKDRSVVTFDGVRIGLTGATYDDSNRASSAGDLKFSSTLDATKTQAAALRSDGADFVVSVVHADRRQDYQIIQSGVVDLLLTGHDHDLFVNYNDKVAAVEPSYDGHYVVAVDVTINVREQGGRRTTTWWPQFRIIDTATVTPDPEVAAVVAEFEQQFSKEMDVPLGTTDVELDSRTATVRTREAAIGNLIADALRASTRADAVIINGGGIRGGKVYPPGTAITRRDVLAELPFGNHVVTVEMRGRDLRRAIENGLSQLPDPAGRFPQVSGLTIEADSKMPAGRRVKSIKVGNAALSDTKLYRVATIDFLGRGGDGYDSFRDARHLMEDDDAPLLANEVMIYIRDTGTIRTRASGRVVVK
jgi:2',3'-cyclic-nucleotide 2'-phosphodiesterase (5'-nucleotidase family)